MKNIKYISDYKNSTINISSSVLPYVLQNFEGLRGLEADLDIYQAMSQDISALRSVNIRERAITLKAAIVYNNDRERDQLRKKVFETFHIKRKGRIEITTRANMFYELENVYVLDAPTFDENLNRTGMDFFSVNLISLNPYFLSPEKKISLQNKTGNFKFTWEILENGVSLAEIDSKALKNCYNGGAVETPLKMIIRSRGTLENPFIYNITTNEAIRINKTLNQGEEIIITTNQGNKRIEHIDTTGTKTNIFNLIDLQSTFFSLVEGDNQIKYGADGNVENMTVDLYYRERSLGI